jgi:hypothetical protein
VPSVPIGDSQLPFVARKGGVSTQHKPGVSEKGEGLRVSIQANFLQTVLQETRYMQYSMQETRTTYM